MTLAAWFTTGYISACCAISFAHFNIELQNGNSSFNSECTSSYLTPAQWYMDDDDVSEEHARYQCEADESRGLYRLLISSACKRDEGAFKCKAENREGVASTTGYLSVTGTCTWSPGIQTTSPSQVRTWLVGLQTKNICCLAPSFQKHFTV